PSVDALFKLGPAKTLFDKVAVPIVITYGGENVASKVLSKFAGKMVQGRGVEGWGKKELLGGHDSSHDVGTSARPSRAGALIAESTLSTKYLLYLGFVNMDKGI